MPFKSKAQRAYLYAHHPSIAKRWEEHTPSNVNLPEKVKRAVFFTGRDFKNLGGGSSAVPGATNGTPAPIPSPPVPHFSQPTPLPAALPSSPFSALDPRTMQGFGTWAAMLHPVTRTVLGAGGMPALMGIYGQLSNNADWRTATTARPGAAGTLFKRSATTHKAVLAAAIRYFEKRAQSATPAPRLPTPAAQSPLALAHQAHLQQTRNTMLEQDALQSNITHGIGNIATGMALPRVARNVAPAAVGRLGGRAFGGLPFMGAETIFNLGADTTNALGLTHRPQGGRVYELPVQDVHGNHVINPNGTLQTRWGFNPSAIGADMTAFRQSVTPNREIVNGVSTGIGPVDATGSYLTSALNAFNHPGFSLYEHNRILNPLSPSSAWWSAANNPRTFLRSLGHELTNW